MRISEHEKKRKKFEQYFSLRNKNQTNPSMRNDYIFFLMTLDSLTKTFDVGDQFI